MPIVSVVTPFHCTTPFLAEAVRSVLGQTLGDLEMLLVDNGAGTGLAPLGPLARDPRVRLVTPPKPWSIARGRNAGIAAARGEFIAFLDHDDLARPRRLERQVDYLRANPRCGLVSVLTDAIDAAGAVTGRQFTLLGDREQREFSRFTMPVPLSSLTVRRDLCERFAFRAENDLAEDYDFHSRAVETCSAAGLPERLAAYRSHAGQSTAVQWSRQVFAAARVRLMTARRRAGRPEGTDEQSCPVSPPPPAATYRAFAAHFLQEGFGELAAYHARKLAAVQPAALPWALCLLFRAARREPRAAGLFARMFLTGPLRTHGLRPG